MFSCHIKERSSEFSNVLTRLNGQISGRICVDILHLFTFPELLYLVFYYIYHRNIRMCSSSKMLASEYECMVGSFGCVFHRLKVFFRRQQVLYPFMVIDQLGKFDVDAGVIGGGETGE